MKFLQTMALVIAIVAGVMLPMAVEAADAPLPGSGTFFAIKAPPGYTFYITANAGTKANQKPLFNSDRKGFSEQSSDGWYYEPVPADIDLSKMIVWCAMIFEPVYIEEAVCDLSWKEIPVPTDGIYRGEYAPNS